MTDARRPAEWDQVEAWMNKLGVTMVNVWFFDVKDHRWKLEPQVDDHDTFLETVEMTFQRERSNYACWFDGEKWCLLKRRSGDTKRYPNREAAEMVAIHGA